MLPPRHAPHERCDASSGTADSAAQPQGPACPAPGPRSSTSSRDQGNLHMYISRKKEARPSVPDICATGTARTQMYDTAPARRHSSRCTLQAGCALPASRPAPAPTAPHARHTAPSGRCPPQGLEIMTARRSQRSRSQRLSKELIRYLKIDLDSSQNLD